MSVPRLRDDLRITPLSGAEKDTYVIEDPLRNLFFKVGRREYRFLCRLEAGVSPEALAGDEDGAHGDLSREEALTLLKWLAAKQLLKNQSPDVLQRIDQAEQQARRKSRLMARLNPLIFRVPLFNPDPLLERLMPWIGWLAGPLFLGLWVVLGFISMSLLLTNWDRFVEQTDAFFSPQNLLVIAIIWVLLKLVHELSHSVACNRHGGRVYEVGILFILFIPLTYVNGTSSWSFPSRWQRIQVGMAGIFMELFVTWCAIIYWATHMGSPSGMIAHYTVLIAGVSSLLFNANPLMRFDGYYILSDLVNVPNLYFRGLAAVRQIIDRVMFGISAPEDSVGAHPLIAVYGMAVHIWRILVVVTLSVLACSMLGGWGLLLGVMAMGSWVYQVISSVGERIRGQFFLRSLLLCGVVGILLFGVRYRENLSFPAVILFTEQESVRADAPGRIERIEVSDGDEVSAGQLLVELVNVDLEAEARDCELQVQIADLRKRRADALGDYAASQVLAEQLDVLRERMANLRADLDSLRLSAPVGGTVVGDLDDRIGTYVRQGEELFQIIGRDNKQVVASVGQNDISALQGETDTRVSVDMTSAGLGRFDTVIDSISPTASRRVAHFSFAAQYGGVLDVRVVGSGSNNDGYEYFTPRFDVKVKMPGDKQSLTHNGQAAQVNVKGIALSPALHLWQRVKRWYEGKQGRE